MSDDFIDESEQFNTALAYLQKGSPVEALALFDGLAKKTKIHFWRAASLFWAGEALLGLRKPQEARERRERLLNLLQTDGLHYVAAARYALAQERCEARDYEGCLSLLEGQSWEKGELAYEEAFFLKGWAQAKMGSVDEAIDTWTMLANAKGRLAFQALVALGHLYLQRKIILRRKNAMQRPRRSVQGEVSSIMYCWEKRFTVSGGRDCSWAESREQSARFSLFMRRHPKHLLRVFVQAGFDFQLKSSQSKNLTKD